jgi:drug/metabolite transporter (DMT)-like permease
LLSVINGLLSALSWGAGDFAGGLATRKLGPYRAVFFGDLLGLLLLLLVNTFYREAMPSISSLILAGLAGMCGSVGLMTLYYSMAHGPDGARILCRRPQTRWWWRDGSSEQ